MQYDKLPEVFRVLIDKKIEKEPDYYVANAEVFDSVMEFVGDCKRNKIKREGNENYAHIENICKSNGVPLAMVGQACKLAAFYIESQRSGFIDSEGNIINPKFKDELVSFGRDENKISQENNPTDNKLSKLRNKISKKIDKTLGTNLEDKKLPTSLKKLEDKASKAIFDSKVRGGRK